MASSRLNIPADVRREVLIEAGYRCAVPTCRNVIPVHLHHIDEVSQGGGPEPSNLIVLCPTCHSLYHSGQISKEAIRVYKSMLVALNNAVGKVAIDDLLFLHKQPHPLLSGDGVLRFASLIVAGLVRLEENVHVTPLGYRTPQYYGHRVHLTEKGTLLVEAWERGDDAAIQTALRAGSR
jgi:HNH endonuclease